MMHFSIYRAGHLLRLLFRSGEFDNHRSFTTASDQVLKAVASITNLSQSKLIKILNKINRN